MTRPTKAEGRKQTWQQKYDAARGGAAKLKVAVSELLAAISRVEEARPDDAEAARLHAAEQIHTLAASLRGRTRK